MEHFLHRQVPFRCKLAPYIRIILTEIAPLNRNIMISIRGYESTKCHIQSRQTEDCGLLVCDVYQTTRCQNAEEHNIQSGRWGEVTLKLSTSSTLDLLNITLEVIQTGNHHSRNTVHVSRTLLQVETTFVR
jgi:hypothetical protein